MATAAQIEANRRNAQKSSGPKTEKGKARVRYNAFKHGMNARTTMPGLTHEDPDQLREKTLRLINDLQPSNEAELDQVCQAARLTLAIERADRFEMAHMNQRIREAARERVQEVNPRLLEEIQELGRRLLYYAGMEEGHKYQPDAPAREKPADPRWRVGLVSARARIFLAGVIHLGGGRGQVPQAAALVRRPAAAGRQARSQRRGLPLAAGAVGRIPHPAGPRSAVGHAGLAPLHPAAR